MTSTQSSFANITSIISISISVVAMVCKGCCETDFDLILYSVRINVCNKPDCSDENGIIKLSN